MRIRTKLSITIALFFFASLAAAVWLYDANRPRISFACYAKIEKGMTRQQVEAILGGPPRWDVAPKRSRDILRLLFSNCVLSSERWVGIGGIIDVGYSDGDTVRWKHFEELPFEPRPPTFKEIAFPWTKKRTMPSPFDDLR